MAAEEKKESLSAPPYEKGRRVGDFELVEVLGPGCVAGNLLFRANSLQSVAIDMPPGSAVGFEVMLALAGQTKAARRARARFELLATTEADAMLRYLDMFNFEEGGREIPCVVTSNPPGQLLTGEIAAHPEGHTFEETKTFADILLRSLSRLSDAGAPMPRLAARNIFIKNPKEAAFINLAIADIDDLSSRASAHLTDFEYLAPDLLSGGRDDEVPFHMFGLGVCLFEYLYGAGRKPFGTFADHASWLQFWKATGSSTVPQHLARVDLPPSAQAFLDHCLAVDRNNRFRSFSEAIQSLHSGGTTRTGLRTSDRPSDTSIAARTKIVGDYELIGDAPIGLGAQGVVWKATCKATGKEFVRQGDVVALKILNPHVGDLSKTEHRFRSLCKLRHPNIVEYKDVFIHPDGARCCIAMEFVEGDALDKILEKNRATGLPWPQARSIINQCLDALAYASTQNVVHRDIKPPNVHVTPDGRVKIIDFEIARRVGGASSVPTVQGFAGTFAYMAPEFAGENPFSGDEASDVFSAGICFVEVLSGSLPFDAFVSDQQHFEFIRRWLDPAKWPQPRLDQVRSPVPLAEVKAFLTRMVQPNRVERYPKFSAALTDFQRFLPMVIGEDDGERYEFDESTDLLGKGGFGSVYRARRLRDGQIVAVKRLTAQKYLKRFAREKKILQRIQHPNIVRFLDFVEMPYLGQSEYFIVMEYLEGMPDFSLRRRLKAAGGPLPVKEVIGLFASYLAAVEHLHENGVIHRDLTPNNLYAPPGRTAEAKVIDLGVAMDETGTLSVTGGLPGVPDYMAPEFATRDNVRGSPQTDLFSLGICFYEALTGHRPYPQLPADPKRSWSEWVKRCQKLPPVDFSAAVFRQNPALRKIAERVMAEEPERRYLSAAEMAREIVSALESSVDEDTIATQMGPALIAETEKAPQQARPSPPKQSEIKTTAAQHDAQQRPISSTQRWVPPTPEKMQKILPQYEFLAMLGAGGMGAVYKARQISLDRFVAIKILPPGIEDDMGGNFVERFKNEARMMGRMNHPCIVNVYESGEASDGQLYFVMEYVDGTDLQKLIRANKRLKPDDALAITAHVCDALQYAHSRGVIHRDIKPANILISEDGSVKIADFGLAKSYAGQSTDLTRANIALGTPYFMAPEALQMDVKLDARADLYAVGVMLYNMLTGELPVGGWKMPSELVRSDPRLDNVIRRATEKNRDHRYQTAAEIRKDLDTILTTPIPKAISAGETTGMAVVTEKATAKPTEKPREKPPHPKPKPVIIFASADRAIQKNGSTKLSWSVKQADNVTLDGQRVESVGEKVINPSAKTRYRLVATGPGGNAEQEVVVGIAMDWKPVIRMGSLAAAAAIIIAAGSYWWTHHQIGFKDYGVTMDSANNLVATLHSHRAEQVADLQLGAGSKFAETFAAEVEKKTSSGERREAAGLVLIWSQVASLLQTNGVTVDPKACNSLEKKIADSSVAAGNVAAQASNIAAAQALLVEWNSITSQLAGVATFDPSIAERMRTRVRDMAAKNELSDLLKEVQSSTSLASLQQALEKYAAYFGKWNRHDDAIENQSVAAITNLVVAATANFTTRPAALDGFEKIVNNMVSQHILPPAAGKVIADAETRIDGNVKDRTRLKLFSDLKASIISASTVIQLDPLHEKVVGSTLLPDQKAALTSLLDTRAAVAIDAVADSFKQETDSKKLSMDQAQLHRLPNWMQGTDRFKQRDDEIEKLISAAKMGEENRTKVAALRASIPQPLVSYPSEYANFVREISKVQAGASNEMLYPTIAGDIATATGSAENNLTHTLNSTMDSWNSAERPAELAKWISAARSAITPDLPAWAASVLTKTIEQAGRQVRQTEIVVMNDSRYAVDLRWPESMARLVDHIAPGAKTNYLISSESAIDIQIAVAAVVPGAARRKAVNQSISPGRRNSISLSDSQFALSSTTITWSGPKDAPGLVLQVDGTLFAAGQSKVLAPDTSLKLEWKRPDYQDTPPATQAIPASDKVDLAQFQPAAADWKPTPDFVLVKNFISQVSRGNITEAAALKDRAASAKIADEATRQSRDASIKALAELAVNSREAAVHGADRTRAACYLFATNCTTREGRIGAAGRRLAGLQERLGPGLHLAADARSRFWLGLLEKGVQLSVADIESAIPQIPNSAEQEADKLVLTYLLGGDAKAPALPQNHPEYNRYNFHIDRLPNFLKQDIEESRIIETADAALSFLLAPPPSVTLEADDIASAELFIKTARVVADKQSDWVNAQTMLKSLQSACQKQAAKLR